MYGVGWREVTNPWEGRSQRSKYLHLLPSSSDLLYIPPLAETKRKPVGWRAHWFSPQRPAPWGTKQGITEGEWILKVKWKIHSIGRLNKVQTNSEEESKTCCWVSVWDSRLKTKDISISSYFYHFILVVCIHKMLDTGRIKVIGKLKLTWRENTLYILQVRWNSFSSRFFSPKRINISSSRSLWSKFLKCCILTYYISYLLLHNKEPQNLVARNSKHLSQIMRAWKPGVA